MGTRTAAGYGQVSVRGRVEGAHRVAYVLTYGDLPPDKPLVCHHCDNPPCVRPDHLFAGNYSDNAQDMLRKGRGPYQKP